MSEVISSMIGFINAGGRGTRLNGLFTPDPETGIAKALLATGSLPVKLIDHHIANLQRQNIERIVVAAGDQPQVYEYVNDIYRDDMSVCVTRSLGQLGTGGDLIAYARKFNPTDPIIVQNVDTILDINLEYFGYHFIQLQQLGAQACISLTLNRGVPNEGAYIVGPSDRVMYSREFNDEDEMKTIGFPKYEGSSTGAVIIHPDFLFHQNWSMQDGQLSLYRQMLRQAWQADNLHAYNNGHNFFRDIGAVATWLESEKDTELHSLLCYPAVYNSVTN